jgi:polyribonucleotide nucleotidyltransferase
VKEFGCFVELFYGIEGLVPVEELGEGRGAKPGDEMTVKLLGVNRDGKLQLSQRAALGESAADLEDA